MSTLSSMAILGGGPAGLYTAILLRRRMPDVRVQVFEQNPEGATFGFGVVFSDQALEFLKAADPDIHDLLIPQMEQWQSMTLNLPRDRVVLDGVGFSAVGRLELIEILRKQAQASGVEITFGTSIDRLDMLKADLVIGADGVNSLVRRSLSDQFKPSLDHFGNHFAWFGSDRPFDTLTQSFITTDKGPLNAQAARWGNAFAAAGAKRGERIAFFLDDTPSYPAAFFGAVRAGFVPVLLNTMTTPEVLNFFLRDTDARFAICEADLATVFDPAVMAGTCLKTVVVTNGAAEGFITEATFLDGQPETLARADTGPDDMAFWMYSSGSTGMPKGIVHLHHDMAYTQASFGENILKLRSDDICYSVPKMYFAYGFGNSATFPFSVGATALLMPGQPRPDAVLAAIETHKPTVLFGLPTLFTAVARHENAGSTDFSSVRQSMSAAEILSEDIYRRWVDLVGHGPTEGLGSTEMLHVYLSNALDDHRIGAAGARVPGYEIRLETPDGKNAGPGEEGVMYVRGTSSAPMYWNRPDKTADTMRSDWIYTGDRFVERDGYYYFQGRADDLIKVSGQWVWPLEVERCLNEHPDVHECAVLAHQMDDARVTLRAVVRLRDGVAQTDTQSDILRGFVKTRLQPYKYPRLIDYTAELPKTGTGKIDRQALITKPAV